MVSCNISQAEKGGVYVLKFKGEVRLNVCSTLDLIIDKMREDKNFITVIIDLTEASIVDSTTLGLLAKIGIFAQKSNRTLPTIISVNPDITRLVVSMGFDELFVIVEEAATEIEQLNELPLLTTTEKEVQEKVLNAHKVLMELNAHNRETFEDLVKTLEEQS